MGFKSKFMTYLGDCTMSIAKSEVSKLTQMKLLAVTSMLLITRGLCAQTLPSQESSSVQMYGLIGFYIDKSKVSSQPPVPLQLGGGGLTTSYWGLGSQENLGGGNKVIFALESFFRPTTVIRGAMLLTPSSSVTHMSDSPITPMVR
jgi:hypothetical protein